jgi:ferredoxin
MATVVDPNLLQEIKKYGAYDISACFHCGNCSAVCPLTNESTSFPRKLIRLGQIGAADRLKKSIDPWLCFYCGECSETCPRDAQPGEYMMTLRRYLIASYDWTGLARLFYKSAVAEITALVLVGLFVVALFARFHGQVVTDHVALNTFAPVHAVELGDLIMAGALSFFLLSNAFRMAWGFMGSSMFRIPLGVYVKQVPTFLANFLYQKKWRSCNAEEPRKGPWLTHVFLVTGYLSMMTLIIGLLRWFQTDNVYPFYHPQRLWGYYATAALLYGTVAFMVARWRKADTPHRFSEASDWIFLIMLFLTALTGIVMHAFRLADLPMATYVSYVIHLAIAVPMLVVEVPFGKWSHLLYRPLALYLFSVQEAARTADAKALAHA